MPDLANYRIDVYDDSGVSHGSLTGSAAGGPANNAGFLSMSCVRRVNAPGLLIFSLRGDHPLLATLADKWQFELWRKPTGGVWGRELAAIFRERQWRYTDKSNIELRCPGVVSLLDYRIIDWPANTANRTVFNGVAGETIMKTLVTYNATSSATTGNGRKRAGTNWPATQITVETDGASGNDLEWYCFGQRLLESLQKLAPSAGGDFDLVKTSPTAYNFRWGTWSYVAGTLTAASDRSTSVKFALGLGNMGTPEYFESRMEERTVACVWGQGEDTGREYATVTGANYSASNDIEMFVDARDVAAGNTTGLADRGTQKLQEVEAKRAFRFGALQAPATLYGVDYFLGDLVKVVDPANDTEYTQKVASVTQVLRETGDQEISGEFGAP